MTSILVGKACLKRSENINGRGKVSGAILDAPLSIDKLEDMNKGKSQDQKPSRQSSV